MSGNAKQFQTNSERQQKLRLAVLVSGTGSNLQALIDAIENKQLSGVEIVLVVSNKPDVAGLQRALKHRLPAIFLPWKQREQAEAKLIELIHIFQADIIVLAGWMRILSPEFTTRFPQRIINLHPSLLPDNGTDDSFITGSGSAIPVLRGLHVVQRAIDEGLPITGSTVHFVTPEVDAGPAICRAEVPIAIDDTEDTLHEKIKQQEHRLIVEAIRNLAERELLHSPR